MLSTPPAVPVVDSRAKPVSLVTGSNRKVKCGVNVGNRVFVSVRGLHP